MHLGTEGVDDAHASPLSTSIVFDHVSTKAGLVSQCASGVVGGLSYDLRAQVKLLEAFSGGLTLEKACTFYSESDCQGDFVGEALFPTQLGGDAGIFELDASTVTASGGARS